MSGVIPITVENSRKVIVLDKEPGSSGCPHCVFDNNQEACIESPGKNPGCLDSPDHYWKSAASIEIDGKLYYPSKEVVKGSCYTCKAAYGDVPFLCANLIRHQKDVLEYKAACKGWVYHDSPPES